jgi:hypothetical protein
MLHKRKKDRISITNLRKKTKLKEVTGVAKKLKWDWAGHDARYPQDRLAKAVEDWIPNNTKRSRGRPKA